MRISGNFNGTGAALYICCGFMPHWVKLYNVTDDIHLQWNINMRLDASVEGQLVIANGTKSLLTVGAGIVQYEGGETLTSALQTSTDYGEGVYLYPDPIPEYSHNATYGYVSNPITNWTLDTSANRTGHFNDDVPASVARIGAGSRILIRESNNICGGTAKWATINVLTAGQGISANEVELSRAIGTGSVMFIGGKYNFIPAPLATVTAQGFKINDVACNVDTKMMAFEAGTYDNSIS